MLQLFITGFPGFLSSRLVEELAEILPEARFILLVEKKMLPSAASRVAALAIKGLHHKRVTLLAGDISEQGLGLSEEDKAIVHQSDMIFHLAAVYDLSVSYDTAFRVNVTGTENILHLAEHCPSLSRLVYFSTAYVSGSRKGVVLEQELEAGQSFKNHYESTKFEAEKRVRAKMPQLPVTIIRPGIVAGESTTGETVKFDGPYYAMRFLHTISSLPIPNISSGNAPVNIVPWDYVVKSTARIALHPDAAGATVHLADPAPMRAQELYRTVSQHITGKTPSWRLPEWMVSLSLRIPAVRRFFGTQREVLDYFSCGADYSTETAQRLLEGTGISCAPMADRMPVMCSYFLRTACGAAGGFQLPQAGDIPQYAPQTGEVCGAVTGTPPETVPVVVDASRTAAVMWGETPVRQRVQYLKKMREILTAEREQVVRFVCRITGKTPVEAVTSDLIPTLDALAWLEKYAEKHLDDEHVPTPLLLLGRSSRIEYHPRGVVAVISPWNYPLQLTVVPVATALAAGNSVVLKPSEVTPAMGALVQELAQRAGLPDGVLQVVQGDGAVGAALVGASPDMVFFTGSVATGQKVMRACAEKMIPHILELGGKDAMVVFDDAHLERAVEGALWGAYSNAGQMCMSVERIYVQRGVCEAFVARLKNRIGELRIGGGEADDIGAMTSPRQADIVVAQVKDAVAGGAELFGVKELGRFISPGFVINAPQDALVVRDETFGPVAVIVPFSTEEEGMQFASEGRYGLNASLWTGNTERAKRLIRHFGSGAVVVNDVSISVANPYLPFGGEGESGIGRYHGREGLRSFSRTVSVVQAKGCAFTEPHWFPYAGKYAPFMQLVGGYFGKRRSWLQFASGFYGVMRNGTGEGLLRWMLGRTRDIGLAQIALWVYMAALLVGSAVPMQESMSGGGDKLDHIIGYALLGILFSLVMPRSAWRRAAAYAWVFGVWMEIMQFFLPWRNFSIEDMLANFAGAVAGSLLILSLFCLKKRLRA